MKEKELHNMILCSLIMGVCVCVLCRMIVSMIVFFFCVCARMHAYAGFKTARFLNQTLVAVIVTKADPGYNKYPKANCTV